MATTSKRKVDAEATEIEDLKGQVRDLAYIVRRLVEAQQANGALTREEQREMWQRLDAIDQD